MKTQNSIRRLPPSDICLEIHGQQNKNLKEHKLFNLYIWLIMISNRYTLNDLGFMLYSQWNKIDQHNDVKNINYK